MPKKTALILAGAVAKGAFEAGVLSVLSRRSAAIPITRIVAASSGALNAAVYSTGIRTGQERQVADRLVQLWSEEANWHNVLRPSATALLGAQGVGTADRLAPLMSEAMAPLAEGPLRPVRLALVLAMLDGRAGEIGDELATTFECTADFEDEQFDTEDGRDTVIRAALGSAAFPVLFAPVDVPGIGACVDGGAVNNTPIKHAIADDGIERVIVVTPEPLRRRPQGARHGVHLVSQIAEILINERLYRDLHEAESVNGVLLRLDALTEQGVPPEALEKVKRVLGWKPLEVVQVRPLDPLRGSAFSAFSDADQMREYIESGRRSAEAALRDVPLDPN